jgi:hypothetical protein
MFAKCATYQQTQHGQGTMAIHETLAVVADRIASSKGITDVAISESTGIPVERIKEIFNRRPADLTVHEAEKITAALKINASDFARVADKIPEMLGSRVGAIMARNLIAPRR